MTAHTRGGLISAMLFLLCAQTVAAQDSAAEAESQTTPSTGAQTRSATALHTSSQPAVAGSSVLAEAQAQPLQTLSGLDLSAPGICLVVGDALREFCAQFPEDSNCKTP